jgi:hypothetical protein
LNKRKLCTDEIGEVKIKKSEKKKKKVLQSEKIYKFFTVLVFWLLLWLCISKMICRASEGTPIKNLNRSKWRRNEKDLPK